MKRTQELTMTGAERALYAATLEFALHVVKMSEAEAQEAAVNKIYATTNTNTSKAQTRTNAIVTGKQIGRAHV